MTSQIIEGGYTNGKKAYMRAYYLKNKPRFKRYGRKTYLKRRAYWLENQRRYYWQVAKPALETMRRFVFEHYGAKCVCCSESFYEFLTLDHVNGGGNAERRAGIVERKLYRKIIAENFPSSYQILCMNCNWGKGKYKQCPHLTMAKV